MKRVIYIILAVMIIGAVMQACTAKLCPAYDSYPQARGRR